MNSLPITLTMAAASALIVIWLGARVSMLRRAKNIYYGDGGDAQVLRRMRAQANFAEYAPFFLILMALVEMARGSTQWLWAIGIAFIIARLLHPFGMEGAKMAWARIAGIAITLAALAALALIAIYIPYQDRANLERNGAPALSLQSDRGA